MMGSYLTNPVFVAANLVHDAALTLAEVATAPDDAARYLEVAVRLSVALESRPSRPQVLAASPRIIERSGRVRTVVEMIEAEPGDDESRLRLVTLLLRALIWEPPDPAALSRQMGLFRRALIHYQGELIRRRLGGLRRVAPGPGQGPTGGGGEGPLRQFVDSGGV
jgi:hypothetical protein